MHRQCAALRSAAFKSYSAQAEMCARCVRSATNCSRRPTGSSPRAVRPYSGAFRALLRHLEQGGQIVMNEADEGYFYLDSHEKWLKALESEALPFTKAVLYPSHDISDLLISRLKHMGSFEIAPSVMFGGELHNIEINRRGVNKGQGLRWLAKELGCTMENLAAIGDSDNDLTMLRAAGLGIAMANSRKNVRLTADVVTGSNTENGVAQAIERYILEEKL